MTPEERKTWAHDRLDQWLREHEEGRFFDAIDALGQALWELGECPTHAAPGYCCDYIFKGDTFSRSVTELAEVIDLTAQAFIRQAS